MQPIPRRALWAIPLALLLSGCLDDPKPKPATEDGDTSTSTETEDADTSTSTSTETEDADTSTSTETEDADTSTSTETEDADTRTETEDADTSTETEDAETSPEDGDASLEDTDTSDEIEDAETEDTVLPTAPYGLVVTRESTAWTLANERFSLVLDQRAGWQPYALTSLEGSGQNLIYGNTVQTNEAWVGLSLYNRVHLWSLTTSPTTREEGPALVRATRIFGLANELSGSSEIVVHADGRIVMSWDLTVPNTATPATLVAYAVLDIARFTHAQAGASNGWSLPTGETGEGGFTFLTTSLGDIGYLCARHAVTRDAVGFVERSVDGLNTLAPRITEHAGGAELVHSIRLQYDLARDNVPAGSYAGRVMLTVSGDGSGCARVSTLADAFRAPPSWTVTVGQRRTSVLGDADADGFVETGGYYAFDADSGALAISPDAELPSATLRVFGAGALTGTNLVLDGSPLTPGADFVSQPAAGGDGLWIVVTRPIGAGDVVQLSP